MKSKMKAEDANRDQICSKCYNLCLVILLCGLTLEEFAKVRLYFMMMMHGDHYTIIIKQSLFIFQIKKRLIPLIKIAIQL
jgi:hypothetical protein